jgi:hypothetical protein
MKKEQNGNAGCFRTLPGTPLARPESLVILGREVQRLTIIEAVSRKHARKARVWALALLVFCLLRVAFPGAPAAAAPANVRAGAYWTLATAVDPLAIGLAVLVSAAATLHVIELQNQTFERIERFEPTLPDFLVHSEHFGPRPPPQL